VSPKVIEIARFGRLCMSFYLLSIVTAPFLRYSEIIVKIFKFNLVFLCWAPFGVTLFVFFKDLSSEN